MTAREAVLRALYDMDKDGAYLNAVLSDALAKEEWLLSDRGFITELIYGVVSNKIAIDFIISKFSSVKIKKLSLWVLNILRMGIFQIYYMDKIPHSAACNESVKLAKRYSHKAGIGFVNGVLRSFAREAESFSFPKDNLSLRYSYPEWMTEKIISEYGTEKCEMLFEENTRAHSPYIRVNTLKTSPSELIKTLKAEGVECVQTKELENCLMVLGGLNINKSKAYKEGLYSLQNISSQTAVRMLDAKMGETVIDMCAAPGGKTCAIAEGMNNVGKIYAFDIFDHKIKLIENAAKRLGIDIIDARVNNSEEYQEDLKGIADKVLADVPCSGLGVIHKKPDIKYSRTPQDVEKLTKIQKNILENASKYVKSGGILIYSTCTIIPEENRLITACFLKEHNDFSKVDEVQLLTTKKGESGFYICKMKKK